MRLFLYLFISSNTAHENFYSVVRYDSSGAFEIRDLDSGEREDGREDRSVTWTLEQSLLGAWGPADQKCGQGCSAAPPPLR